MSRENLKILGIKFNNIANLSVSNPHLPKKEINAKSLKLTEFMPECLVEKLTTLRRFSSE